MLPKMGRVLLGFAVSTYVLQLALIEWAEVKNIAYSVTRMSFMTYSLERLSKFNKKNIENSFF